MPDFRPASFFGFSGTIFLGCCLTGLVARADTAPQLLNRVEPVYPVAMAGRAEDGSAVGSFVVDPGGHPADLKIVRASDPVFGEAAVMSIRAWTYEPAMRNHQPVRSARLTETIKFRAPWNVKLGPLCGRNVFVELFDSPVDEGALDHPLQLIDHWKPAEQPRKTEPANRPVTVTFVVATDGQVVNPEIDATDDPDEAFGAVYTLVYAKWVPPVRDGKPVNVRVRRTMTRLADSRQWTLPDPIARPFPTEIPVEAQVLARESDHPPVCVHRVDPKFPADLRRRGARGTVEVELVVTSSGDVADVKIFHSTREEFNEPVIEAVRQWKFKPGVKGGRPVNTHMRQSMTFDVHWN